jgi:small subunit ribosomal protein S21
MVYTSLTQDFPHAAGYRSVRLPVFLLNFTHTESHAKGGGTSMKVELRESESFDGLLRRFTKEMQKSGKLREYRSKRRFVSKSEQRRAKIRKAEHKRRRKEATGR